MRQAMKFSLALAAILGTPQLLRAQEQTSSAEAGRRLAINWCTGCHAVEPNAQGLFAADFADIANTPSTTSLSLKVSLRTSHKNMPNFILQPEEADDIVAYILSLRRK